MIPPVPTTFFIPYFFQISHHPFLLNQHHHPTNKQKNNDFEKKNFHLHPISSHLRPHIVIYLLFNHQLLRMIPFDFQFPLSRNPITQFIHSILLHLNLQHQNCSPASLSTLPLPLTTLPTPVPNNLSLKYPHFPHFFSPPCYTLPPHFPNDDHPEYSKKPNLYKHLKSPSSLLTYLLYSLTYSLQILENFPLPNPPHFA